MLNKKASIHIAIACFALAISGCKLPQLAQKKGTSKVPNSYGITLAKDTTNSVATAYKTYFSDAYLTALIDTALSNNQELNITLREIEMSRNEIKARKGEYLPFVGLRAGAGLDKTPRYTNIGAMEANTEIAKGQETPDPLPDMGFGAYATWEVDIWRRLRNAKKAAVNRYLATVEGKNFLVTHIVAEIANSYFELLALDNQLSIVEQNIAIQTNALKIVKLEKEATRVTELAVRRFEAQVLSTQSMQYNIKQQITETENRINLLLGRYPQPILRNDANFETLVPRAAYAGIPAQLLSNRPDIRQAEQELAAAKLDVQAARARFYPSLGITASFGSGAFSPSYLLRMPESILGSLAGDLAAPLVNRNAIKAAYLNANEKQIQAVYNYERTLLSAYLEVVNQMAKLNNMEKTFDLKQEQVKALSQSVDISNRLFRSARADYMEVLLTQRDALEARFELIETKKQQLNAMVNIYQALGGGWKQ
jgi:outer membrane protein, multidrug efflux system